MEKCSVCARSTDWIARISVNSFGDAWVPRCIACSPKWPEEVLEVNAGKRELERVVERV